ncbi:MAG: esterase [Comamonadaceae bacterium]|nr:esterase [Comamonadaceae bacterium]
MNIQDTIARALASAGLDTRSGPMRGVTETIRQSLASAGLGVGASTVPPAHVVTDDDARTFDVEARDLGAVPIRPDATPGHPAQGQFIARSHTGPAGSRAYKLYLPLQAVQPGAASMPLVIMLHGCTQSPDDFAAGTRMNRLADEHGFLVVYPEQPAGANPSRCWNWFRTQDQVRAGGEPEIIAGIVRAVQTERAVADGRVYVAGLSAGAAMALVLGETHPELFSAVGVHSGLPYGSASDIPSALAAMKGRGTSSPAAPRPRQAVPTIVFHGDRDHTVQHRNGEHIVQQAVALHAAQKPLNVRTETGESTGGRRYQRTTHADAAGRPMVEAWTLHGAGHTWSGGDASGSHTDPAGPDASAAMVAFFLAHTAG